MTKQITESAKKYVEEIRKYLADGDASEYTYRTALEVFIRSFESNLRVHNDPRRRKGSSTSKPDFIVKRGNTPIGFVETKDVGVDLDDTLDSEQLKRYLSEYQNLILTDYVEFRRYVNGSLRSSASIGQVKKGQITVDNKGCKDVAQLIDDFLSEKIASVGTSSDLADRLAKLTRQIYKLVRQELEVKEDSARLHLLMEAFQKVLLSDLDEDKFADMFSQTLAYGFFAARVHFDGKGEFSRRTAAAILPKTNPFLRKLFREFADEHMPESLTGVVEELVELLNRANVEAILGEFNRAGRKDAVVHFYESFLAAYDRKRKKSMGVFYTPDPVVSYMVKSVDEILVEVFGRDKGLADEKTLVLDPALGTGSFLNKVNSIISEKVQRGAWDSYVQDCLLDRIFGFEILMAPYSVAHLNLGLQLQESGYKFERNQRLGIYLTNTLEETAKRSEALFADWIAEEANAAASIKRHRPIMVVIGNPPYQKISSNNGDWINGLMRGYDSVSERQVESYFEVDGMPLGEKKLWLNDDYIKFMRFAQWRIEHTGHGVLAFITNHGYLDNPTLRGMRESLMKDFDSLYVIDLHGNTKKRERSPNGEKDENVFDIQTGVSICLCFRSEKIRGPRAKKGRVYRFDLFGTRESKFDWLSKHSWKSTKFKRLDPQTPDYNFSEIDRTLELEYKAGLSIKDVFKENNAGFVTACDNLSIQFSRDRMWNTVKEFVSNPEAYCREKWSLGGNRDWQVDWAQKDAKSSGPTKNLVTRVLYRPFDVRWTYFTGNMKGFLCNPRNDVMKHMLGGKNLALAFTRPQAPTYKFTALVTDCLLDQCGAGNKSAGAGISYIAPLYTTEGKKRVPNFTPEVMERVPSGFTPEEIFAYLYACLSSNEYKQRYSEFLKRDYAKVQFTTDKTLFRRLSKLGSELIGIHCLTDNRLQGGKTIFGIKGSNEVEHVKYDEKNERVYINGNQYFENIRREDWETEVGGYQVLEKWLKDRRGETLDHEQIAQYESINEAIVLGRKICSRIDSAIADAGGWPLAETGTIKKAG